MISGQVVKKFVAATAAALSSVLVTASVAPAAQADVESASNRVLQSVSVAMSPDGTLTGVDGSLVETSGSAEDAEAQASSYAPSDVATDLPVRVLTAWRTSEGAGTDLSDLQGYSGRVAIDLTVQNLTVEPQVLQYDVAGGSRSQAALVGSPLTITASAGLGDLAPATIVTDDEGSGRNVTNGVIGRSSDGTTVQWAAMLAPPTLSSSAELSLVVDAKNFDVPEFDLSVQPGLVTDPSIGALVDSAFNPGASEELELQSRTISLIGEVNAVLARASGTISDVRSNLTSSAETLGTQTVADLQSSTESVTGSMRSLDGALQSLQGDLSSTLESTGSSAVAELDQAVSVVDQLLGDTSGTATAANVSGTGCETAVAPPRQVGSVYANLLQVAGQLKGYGNATDECKVALQASILETIGPEKPDEQACRRGGEDGEPQSVTCSIYKTRATFESAAETLRIELLGDCDAASEKDQGAICALEPGLYEDARDAAIELIDLATFKDDDEEFDSVKELIDAINARRSVMVDAIQDGYKMLSVGGELSGDRGTVGTPVLTRFDSIQAGVSAIREKAIAARDQLITMSGEREDAADEVCALVQLDPPNAGQFEKTLKYLDVECGEDDGWADTVEGSTLDLQIAALNDGLEASKGAADLLTESREDLQKLAEWLGDAALEIGDPEGISDEKLAVLFRKLGEAFDDLDAQADVLDLEIENIKNLADQVDTIEANINKAIDEAKGGIGTGVQDGIEDVIKAGGNANSELGEMFDRSTAGLSSAAEDVTRNGRESVNEQKSAFGKARDASANRLSSEIEGGLSQINQGVSASTRDMEAATALLTADLRKVLLDLGTREVDGGGLLGAMATNAATARTADYQLALATNATTAYANVRGRDIDGIRLQQAQTDAALQMLADLPAFELDLPAGSVHRTVYSYRIGDGQ